ncbi:MAG: sensor histidine kinase [Candidatus Acidiferrales bacterium]
MTGRASNAPMDPRVKNWPRLGSRWALLVGFGTLLAFMAFTGIDSLRSLRAFEANNGQIRQDFLYRENTLGQVRAGLYESTSLLSDYFLAESDSHAQEAFRVQLRSIETETTSVLQSCIHSLPAGKKEPFRHLAMEMEGYWLTIGSALSPDVEGRERDAALRRAVIQRNVKVLSITKDLSALNADDRREAEQRIDEVSDRFRRRLLTIVTIGLGFGLVLAAGTIVYAGRLENRLEEKYEESLQVQQELRELSRQLVDTEERERRAISRELHDEVGQSLSALLLDVQNLAEICGEHGNARIGLQKIRTSVEHCLEQVRDMALLLRPSMLDDLGLVSALEWQAREVSKRTGMVVDMIEENVSDHLPEEHRTCVYRIVQEALNNCSRHAYARNVRVTVRQEQNHLRIGVEDDGKGFDPRRMRGLGLVGMNERISQLGGSLTVNSNPGGGTRLEIDLPVPSA